MKNGILKKKVVIIVLVIAICANMCSFASASMIQPPLDSLDEVESALVLIPIGNGLFQKASFHTASQSALSEGTIIANYITDGVYQAGDSYYVQCDEEIFSLAAHASINLLSSNYIQEIEKHQAISSDVQEKLIKMAEAAENLDFSHCTVEVYSGYNWVSGYQGREYLTEYATMRAGTEYKTIKRGFNPAVLLDGFFMAIGFTKYGKVSTVYTVFDIINNAFYNPTVTASSGNKLQFKGSWQIDFLYTSIKATSLSEGEIGAALMRSVEGKADVYDYEFNLFDGVDNWNTKDEDEPEVIEYSDYYRTSRDNITARQKICYDRKNMALEYDNSPHELTVGTDGKSSGTEFSVTIKLQ